MFWLVQVYRLQMNIQLCGRCVCIFRTICYYSYWQLLNVLQHMVSRPCPGSCCWLPYLLTCWVMFCWRLRRFTGSEERRGDFVTRTKGVNMEMRKITYIDQTKSSDVERMYMVLVCFVRIHNFWTCRINGFGTSQRDSTPLHRWGIPGCPTGNMSICVSWKTLSLVRWYLGDDEANTTFLVYVIVFCICYIYVSLFIHVQLTVSMLIRFGAYHRFDLPHVDWVLLVLDFLRVQCKFTCSRILFLVQDLYS